MSPERRVSPARRKDDLDNEVTRWVVTLTKHRAALFGLASLLGSLFTFVIGTAAMRFYDPAKDIKRVEAKVDSVVIPRLARVEGAMAVGKAERDTLKATLVWISYMQCSQFIESNPGKYVPPICKTRPQ